MAKSIAEYYDILLAIKEGRSELSGLTPHNESSQSFLNDNASGSKVALWRLWLWIMATLAWIMDVKMDIHKEEVDYKLSVKAFGVIRWYHQLALNYQHGHELVWNGQYVYADIDSEDATESRIIKRASVVMVAGVLQFKVAKLNQAGKPEALNTSEKVSFLGYLYELAYPGTNMVVISEAADDLRVRLKMYFDPLLFNTDGSLIADPAIYP
ncbi:MAG: hypothetical protein H0X62_13450, partial [Bacteroidetes bacterium]|nr:hypothetical protein [Bacteroidota bacterium]